MSPGGRKRSSCTSTTVTWLSYASASASKPARSVWPQVRMASLSSQVPITFERNRTVPSTPALVGEVGGASLLGEHRPAELDVRPAPRCRARHTRRRRSAWVRRPPPRRCRASRPRPPEPPHRPDRRQGATARRAPHRGRRGRGTGPVYPEANHQLGVPLPGRDVQQPGRRGVGALGGLVAREAARDQVRDEQQAVGLGRERVGGQLVERVERQVLKAVAPIELLRTDERGHGVGSPSRALLVAVVERLPDEPAGAHQPVVDGPGVDTDRGERPPGVRRRRRPATAWPTSVS